MVNQDWNAYNKSQMNEKLLFLDILQDLCSYVPYEKQSRRGRPSSDLSEMLFACIVKEYECLSSRRVISDLEISKRRGYINKVPHFNTILNYFNDERLTQILTELIQMSALPLRDFEESFAVDASGLSNAFYSRWFDKRFNKCDKYHDWLKVHIICGVKSNIVTHITVTDGKSGDCPQFPELVNETVKNFDVKEVSADKAYSSRENLKLVWEYGATPYIPFKKNARQNKKGHESWSKMFYWFHFHQEEFYKRYHQRSNVETTFSMLKKKFNGKLMIKKEVGRTNEALAKILCHNICVLVKEAYLLGINTNFNEFAQLFPNLHKNDLNTPI